MPKNALYSKKTAKNVAKPKKTISIYAVSNKNFAQNDGRKKTPPKNTNPPQKKTP
jgi:hypothetical protein